ncbi:MFS transporter [Streptomyces sp. NPDC047972]|uniref:MFS transporter n=1 Tax=Streptomyces sp. NPDC047972 TaxID=3365493 RepID=UPI0037181D51
MVRNSGSPPVTAVPRPWQMLFLATTGFALCFWAWALLAPLGPRLRDDLGLSSFEQSLVVAVPVVVGALGRIPAGALTDRWGARRFFPLVAGLTILPVLYLGHLADSVVAALETELVPVGTGAFLGMAAGLGAGSGAVFALVARLVPAERVGSVTGVVGAAGGLGGFFPPLVMGAVDGIAHDYTWGFVLLAVTAAGAGTLSATATATAVRRRARAAADA